MEAETQVKLLSLDPYRHLFPKATLKDYLIKRGARVSDTVKLIPNAVKLTRWQAKAYAEHELSGLTAYEACEKLWYFIKYHIAYTPDMKTREMVRTFRRLMHDQEGDCDCYTTSIDTVLSWVKGIKTIYNRITAYDAGYFQHIYPVVILDNGTKVIMDCVTDRFNYEKPYTKKEDYEMNLELLDGIEDKEQISGNVDAQAMLGYGEMGELGKLFKKLKTSSSAIPGSDGGKKKKGLQKFKDGFKKTMNVLNKANPGTAVLRAGVLASMKTNIMKVAENLKWAYLTEAEAKKRGIDMGKFAKLKNVLTKIEGIFFTAGGTPANLKKAILSGRGNRHHEVNGFGLIDTSEIQFSGLDDNTTLPQLLGEMYNDEFVNGLEGEGLGVIATSAAIASATTIMGTLAALIKSIGNILPKKKGSSDGSGSSGDDGGGGGGGDESGDDVSTSSSDESSVAENTPATSEKKELKKSSADDEGSGDDGEKTNGTNGNESDPDAKGLKAFYDKNKKWIKPVGIIVGSAAVAYVGYRVVKAQKKKTKTERGTTQNGQAALAGFSQHKHKKRKTKQKKGGRKKQHVALM